MASAAPHRTVWAGQENKQSRGAAGTSEVRGRNEKLRNDKSASETQKVMPVRTPSVFGTRAKVCAPAWALGRWLGGVRTRPQGLQPHLRPLQEAGGAAPQEDPSVPCGNSPPPPLNGDAADPGSRAPRWPAASHSGSAAAAELVSGRPSSWASWAALA